MFIGFAVGQTTDFVKYKWQIRRQKKALKSEIEDIRSDFYEKTERIKQVASELNPTLFGYAVPGKISTLIFEKIFSDVAPYFTENERKSIITIYNHVQNFNKEVDNDSRSCLEGAKRSFIIMYHHSIFGHAVSNHFLNSGSDKLFSEESDEIAKLNNEIQSFTKKHTA